MKYRRESGVMALEAMNEGIVLIDTAYNIFGANKTLAKMVGHSMDEVVDKKCYAIIHGEDKPLPLCSVVKTLNTKEPTSIEINEPHLGKGTFLFSSFPVLDIKGDVKFIMHTIKDITDFKRAEKERKEAKEEFKKYSEELERSNRLKDLFIDIMRHDLLNPAGAVRTVAQTALKVEKDPDKKRALQLILRGDERVIEIIEEASTIAKLESGETLESKEADLGTILRNVSKEMTSLADEKKVKIRVATTGKFPALVSSLINVVFTNLISNAIKYGPEDSEVVVGIEDDGANWKIFVADSGKGISDEDKETIFDRFKRREKKGVKGTGLGLTIVKRVVEAYKGRVWVEDNPKGGSVFYVTIPKSNGGT